MDKQDKYLTHVMQIKQRDTDEYVDPRMFGTSARPKFNPPPDSKHHLISRKVLTYMTIKCSVLEDMSPSSTSVHKQMIPVTTRNIRPLTVPSATRDNRATSPLTAPKRVGEVTTRAPMKPVVVSQIQSRYVNLEKFDGKVGEWGNWYDQFEFLAIHYNWDDRERLVRLVSCLKGPALTAHRSFSQTARNTYALCIAALHERYGSRKPALIVTLRAELSTVRQEEGESMEMFGCGVYALTNQAYPDLVNAPTLLQSHAVPAFLKGLRERNAAQEAMKFPNPKSIQEAAVTITHIQGASRVFGIIDAVSLKDPVYIGCQCYKRRVYQESNGDPACPYPRRARDTNVLLPSPR